MYCGDWLLHVRLLGLCPSPAGSRSLDCGMRERLDWSRVCRELAGQCIQLHIPGARAVGENEVKVVEI